MINDSSILRNLCSPAHLRPGRVCPSVLLPKQQITKRTIIRKSSRPRTEGPHRPLQWKADGRSFWRQPAAVSDPGEETSHSPSSIIRTEGMEGAGQSKVWHSTSGLFQTPSRWHIHGSHSYTRNNTYTHSGQWKYSGSHSSFLPFIWGFVLFSSRSHVKVCFFCKEGERTKFLPFFESYNSQ